MTVIIFLCFCSLLKPLKEKNTPRSLHHARSWNLQWQLIGPARLKVALILSARRWDVDFRWQKIIQKSEFMKKKRKNPCVLPSWYRLERFFLNVVQSQKGFSAAWEPAGPVRDKMKKQKIFQWKANFGGGCLMATSMGQNLGTVVNTPKSGTWRSVLTCFDPCHLMSEPFEPFEPFASKICKNHHWNEMDDYFHQKIRPSSAHFWKIGGSDKPDNRRKTLRRSLAPLPRFANGIFRSQRSVEGAWRCAKASAPSRQAAKNIMKKRRFTKESPLAWLSIAYSSLYPKKTKRL